MTRDRGSKPGRAMTAQTGMVHESPGAEGNRPGQLTMPTLEQLGRER